MAVPWKYTNDPRQFKRFVAISFFFNTGIKFLMEMEKNVRNIVIKTLSMF